jgi:7-cyano-7-deazaguanine synthase
MDSATAAALVARDGYVPEALLVDYGQRARAELDSARRVARALGIERVRTVAVDLRALGGSALTDDIDVPKGRRWAELGRGIPVTYVPARNTVLLALALAAAETAGAEAIVIGANAIDFSGYPDCRPDYLRAFATVAQLGTKQGALGRPIHVLAPLLEMTKADIVRRGIELGVPYGETLSCYDPVQRGEAWLHCGRCDACLLRSKGFAEAGVADPAPRAR